MRLFSLLISLMLPGLSLHAAEYLNSIELTAMVSGNTAYCQHLNRPSNGSTYFNPNGTMHGIRRGEARQGSWYVEGDTLCTDWGKRPVCNRYQSDGEWGHYKFTLGGKRIVHVWRWGEGDQVEATSMSGL